MAVAHLIALRSAVEGVASALDPRINIECKHFFSGAAAHANGRIFMTLTSVGLALKLLQESREFLVAQGAQQLRYFPTGPIKQHYVVVPDQIARNPSV